MQAGKMKYRIELLKPIVETNNFGEEVETYVCVRTVYAERVKLSGNRSEEVGEHFPDYRAEFNIRDVHPIENNWHIKQLGGYEYAVTNVIPNIDRGMNTLVCERINP